MTSWLIARTYPHSSVCARWQISLLDWSVAISLFMTVINPDRFLYHPSSLVFTGAEWNPSSNIKHNITTEKTLSERFTIICGLCPLYLLWAPSVSSLSFFVFLNIYIARYIAVLFTFQEKSVIHHKGFPYLDTIVKWPFIAPLFLYEHICIMSPLPQRNYCCVFSQ